MIGDINLLVSAVYLSVHNLPFLHSVDMPATVLLVPRRFWAETLMVKMETTRYRYFLEENSAALLPAMAGTMRFLFRAKTLELATTAK